MSQDKLYIISNGTYSKIGITNNINKRFSTYKTHNPNTLFHYIYTFTNSHDAKRIESTIKNLYKNSRVNKSTEWFDFSVDELKTNIDIELKQRDIFFTIYIIPTSNTCISFSKTGLNLLIKISNNTSQRVFLVLVEMINKNNEIQISQEAIAILLNTSRQTVLRAINYLSKNNFIDISKAGTSNIYKVNPDIAIPYLD